MKHYVISIKRVKNYHNEALPEEKQYWQYAQFDCHGPLASGYPVFSMEHGATKFSSIDDAKEWWKKWGKYLSPESFGNGCNYDYSTLAIRQYISIYKTVNKLQGDQE